ncbi:2673_t:CDS:2 [Diversispora eburnea]|uniref:Guanine nucleotide-binding protein subunit gamma n=1 Tax=Diversispora eburnea TaxID=1213867 RepID=A0A9N9G8U4_9GLOM|nr:2673_t:CDS:2 [Diversispora eburnea]
MHRQQKQHSMSELKLRRLVELNQRLREDLDRSRVRVSEASARDTRDFLVPSVWGPVDKRDDPYAPNGGNCNCIIM